MRWALVTFGIALAAMAACNKDPNDMREWKASDHDHTESPNRAQVKADPKKDPPSGLAQIGMVTLTTWKQKCTRCHGRIGAGDGPQGVALKATNFQDPNWQTRTSDGDIRKAILQGKGAMPKFDLPNETLKGLTRLIRLMVPQEKRSADAGIDSGKTSDAQAR